MRVLLTKKLSSSDMDLIRSWGWEFEVIETLNVIPVPINEIPSADAWVVSSRNSWRVIQQFITRAPKEVFCIGNWMKEELVKAGVKSNVRSFEHMKSLVADVAARNFKSILYFCGAEHRPELEEGLKDSPVKINKAITHQSQMTLPAAMSNFDAVVIFSPRSAESLLMHNQFSDQTVFACIGATTASYLNSRGIRNTFISSYPDSRVLLQEFRTKILNPEF